MSVLIKGMCMPYGCANCCFCSSPLYADGRAIYSCQVPVENICGRSVTDEVVALYEGSLESFPDFCPLVEIHDEHSDLIDFSKLLSGIE